MRSPYVLNQRLFAGAESIATQTDILSPRDKAGQNPPPLNALMDSFRATRALTGRLAEPLSDADATVQSMPDASPAKWHLAHTSWFFETFILRDHVPGYGAFDENFAYLFNSYYEAEGSRHSRNRRGMLTRPSLAEITRYRQHVDEALDKALLSLSPAALTLVELGIHHEQQHQELFLTDILHLFSQNPMLPAYHSHKTQNRKATTALPLSWIEGPKGAHSIGHDGTGFAFDCEGPRHDVLLTPFALASRTVTNKEWMMFIEDGGYGEPRHWLSDGWDWVQCEGIEAPLILEQGAMTANGTALAWMATNRSIQPHLLPISACMRRMLMPAGPDTGCPLKWNGK